MSRFRKLTHAIWHCQYHVVWVPKYRFRVLEGELAKEVRACIRIFSEQSHCEIVELNIQKDHVHLIVMVPPKVSISELMGRLKGRSAIRILKRFSELRKKRYWGNHFWAPGYCVDTVGLDAEMIRRYVRYQEKREKDIGSSAESRPFSWLSTCSICALSCTRSPMVRSRGWMTEDFGDCS